VDAGTIDTAMGPAGVIAFNLEPISDGHQCRALVVGQDRIPKSGQCFTNRLLLYVCTEGAWPLSDDVFCAAIGGLSRQGRFDGL